ncbi:MAG: amidohydrolase [Candidatus Aminicenantes bacterium RBG_16_63_16]|nr:MAG: amidohydrolase [Candidatus Aminicenantes bacterium RBG_16_63_16]
MAAGADLVLLNAVVWTGETGAPLAEAVVLRDGKIAAVGSGRDVRRLAGGAARLIDLGGGLVLPGFIDSHTHFLDGGFSLLSLRLRDVSSREDFVARIARRAGELPKGEWILNGDWDHQQFSPPELPRREWIDAVTPDNPVCVNRHDGHMVLVNTLALRTARLAAGTPSPEGGEILKDGATGEPTGILKDAAIDLVSRHIPAASLAAKLKAAEAALREAAACGVTSVHDMAGSANFEVYQELLRAGKLTARIFLYIPIDELDIYERLRLKTPFGNDRLKIGGLKAFVDGSLGSGTALFFDPYADNPRSAGLLHEQMFPAGVMGKRLLAADRAGLQVAVHAIGDKANAIVLDLFETAVRQNGPRDRRWRIEHAQHLRPSDIPRFGELGVIASVQPFHAADDGRWAESKIGRERCRTTYAFRSLIEGGAVLALGSDWTVAPLGPLTGIAAAVTRRTTDGKNPDGWFPEQRLTLEEALTGYTQNGAYAEFAETVKGTIAPGKLADLVVLDRNIFEIQPENIADARVRMTILDGAVIYER